MEFYATLPIDGAFAEYCVIRTEFAPRVPDSMSNEAAASLEPLSVAITTMRKAGITPGSSILVLDVLDVSRSFRMSRDPASPWDGEVCRCLVDGEDPALHARVDRRAHHVLRRRDEDKSPS